MLLPVVGMGRYLGQLAWGAVDTVRRAVMAPVWALLEVSSLIWAGFAGGDPHSSPGRSFLKPIPPAQAITRTVAAAVNQASPPRPLAPFPHSCPCGHELSHAQVRVVVEGVGGFLVRQARQAFGTVQQLAEACTWLGLTSLQ